MIKTKKPLTTKQLNTVARLRLLYKKIYPKSTLTHTDKRVYKIYRAFKDATIVEEYKSPTGSLYTKTEYEGDAAILHVLNQEIIQKKKLV